VGNSRSGLSRALGRFQYEFSLESRRRKLEIFHRVLQPWPGVRILNIGATPPCLGKALTGEQDMESSEQPELDPSWNDFRVVGLNLDHPGTRAYVEFHHRHDRTAVTADACHLPFPDKSFDIVYSNAVIEHVPMMLQSKMANEMMRVGKSWFITTPNFWYPMEMHHRLPFFQFLPGRIQRAIQLKLRTWPEHETISLLSASRLQALFPTSQIIKVRVTFWPETLIAYSRNVRKQPQAA
jgi:Methyltransferase domain